MTKKVILTTLLCIPIALMADNKTDGYAVADTARTVVLDEVTIEGSIKENSTLRQQPASVTSLSNTTLRTHSVNNIKGVGTMMPNLYMPDYGSKQTNAIYIRGIGSRIGTPAVGLYVDDAPTFSSSAFDVNMYDIESVSILRGPQSTLYGRNTMGGLIKIYTRNPFMHEGTEARLGYATGDNHRNVSLTHYHHPSDRLAFAAGGFYEGSSGFFKNDITNKKADAMESAGGRLRAIWKANSRLTFDASAGFQHVNEGAYPYYYTGATDGQEEYEGLIGKISANREGRYRRNIVTANLRTSYRSEHWALSSITSYEGLHDRMFMDQDFIAPDIYTLEQRQRTNTISEELLLSNSACSWWKPLTGANFFYQWQHTTAPVTFRQDGINWLNSLISTNANRGMNHAIGSDAMTLTMADTIRGPQLPFTSDFDMPLFGASIFHQSNFTDLFGVKGLGTNIGLRLDYEKRELNYRASYDFMHTYGLSGYIKRMDRTIPMVPEKEYMVTRSMQDKLSDDCIQLLPKVAVTYAFDKGNVYATVSRGFRSGGYNVQGFSELLRSSMQTDMMLDIKNATLPVLKSMVGRTVTEEVYNKVDALLTSMSTYTEPDVKGTCSYKPEHAWNYEVGTHLNLLSNRMFIDVTAFWSNVSNLQLSKMSKTGLGRTIINAGKSRSAGVEASLIIRPTSRLTFNGSYGFTHSVFSRYTDQASDGTEVDCKGNYVPFVPQHTFNVDASYLIYRNSHTSASPFSLRNLAFGINCSGAGRIYWDEVNEHSQSAYATFGARAMLTFRNFDFIVWGSNLTNTHYNTFWFKSMSRGYEQHCRPLQVGVDTNLHF